MIEESLFDAALERATMAERVAFLHDACGDDLALRQRVELLLAGHGKSAGILDHTVGPLPLTDRPPHVDSGYVTGSERAGTVVAGRYALLEEIGEGGMGTVFMAEQTQPVQRKVALKVIRPGMDS